MVPLLFVLELVVFIWIVVPDAFRVWVRTRADSLVPYKFLVLAIPVARLIPYGFLFWNKFVCCRYCPSFRWLFLSEPLHWWFDDFVWSFIGQVGHVLVDLGLAAIAAATFNNRTHTIELIITKIFINNY